MSRLSTDGRRTTDNSQRTECEDRARILETEFAISVQPVRTRSLTEAVLKMDGLQV